jgi:hypothetical protein
MGAANLILGRNSLDSEALGGPKTIFDPDNGARARDECGPDLRY